jgi:outer membrane protein assembly factor BamB
MVAIIPTFVILGPLAILAALMPFVFGGLALLLRRWRVLLLVAGMDCTLYFLHSWFRGSIKESWLASPFVLWGFLGGITIAGALWSWYRYRLARAMGRPIATAPPTSTERSILWVISLTGLVVTLFCLVNGTLLESPWREATIIWVVGWVGTLSLVGATWLKGRGPDSETAMLGALAICCFALAGTMLPARRTSGVTVAWIFEPADRGTICASPLVMADRVFVSAIHGNGFSDFGAVYCIDRRTGKEIWKFTDAGGMKQSFSSPCGGDGRVYVGEGLHQDSQCKLYCLSADSGRKLWDFATPSHVESSPCLMDGRVYFGAGDAGVYCLDAATGREIWHFDEGHHVDASPLAVEGRLYVGSGGGPRGKKPEFFCFDAATGTIVWREPQDLPAWGSPRMCGPDICFGVGNGTLDHSAQATEVPAGACTCRKALTGVMALRRGVADAVLTAPAFHNNTIYFGSRDHVLYATPRTEGGTSWQRNLGSPIVAAPTLAGEKLYTIGSAGRVLCLDSGTGAAHWTFDIAGYTHMTARLYSTPRVVEESDGRGRHIYFGAGLDNSVAEAAALFCLEER